VVLTRARSTLVMAVALALLASAGTPRLSARRWLATIRGRVIVPDVSTPASRPAPSDLVGHAHDRVDRRRSVVYLQQAPRDAFGELPVGRARMDQKNEQFVPRVLAITVGTIVDFPNSDTTYHNVFSLARERTFDLGRYPPGKTGGIRFDRPGIIPVFCDIHSHMSAYILVFNHPFFAVTDDVGRYQIPNVPPGSYTLLVWSEVGRAAARRVVVPENENVEADFQVDRSRQ